MLNGFPVEPAFLGVPAIGAGVTANSPSVVPSQLALGNGILSLCKWWPFYMCVAMLLSLVVRMFMHGRAERLLVECWHYYNHIVVD